MKETTTAKPTCFLDNRYYIPIYAYCCYIVKLHAFLQWPYITTMMHQSEMTIQPQIHVPEYSEDSLDAIYRNPKLPGWQDSTPDLWTGECTTHVVMKIYIIGFYLYFIQKKFS